MYFRMIFLEYFFFDFIYNVQKNVYIFRVDIRMICFKIFFTVQCTVTTHQINPIYFPLQPSDN